MRIGIVGASGRVGTRLVELVLTSPGLELSAAWVSHNSRQLGLPVAGGSIEYRAADMAINSHSDVIIDFSTPKASLAFQDQLGDKPTPVVVGTTGFSAEDHARLEEFATRRPLLVGANFAQGFEAFRLSAINFARRMPAAEATVSETYHARKKPEPSGTSRHLCELLRQARTETMGFAAPEPAIAVHRERDVVGINEIRFDLGSAEAVLTYRVRTIAAYAQGAIAAAEWLIETPRPNGLYAPADCLPN